MLDWFGRSPQIRHFAPTLQDSEPGERQGGNREAVNCTVFLVNQFEMAVARDGTNNKAVNLLAGIVLKASGKRMDLYIRDEIFAPMGIVDFTWSLDRAGNPHGMAGLQIRAIDLSRVGQMMLDGGTWKGQRIVSEAWVRLSTGQPGQPYDPTCGLLWWITPARNAWAIDDAMIADLKETGLTDSSLKKIEALKGKEFDGEGVWAALRPIMHQDELVRHKLLELNDRIAKTGRPRPRHVVSGPIVCFECRDIAVSSWS